MQETKEKAAMQLQRKDAWSVSARMSDHMETVDFVVTKATIYGYIYVTRGVDKAWVRIPSEDEKYKPSSNTSKVDISSLNAHSCEIF